MEERIRNGGILRRLEGTSFQGSVFKVRFLFHIFVVRCQKREVEIDEKKRNIFK